MHLGLNWLAQSLALSLTLNGLLNYSLTSASFNTFDGKRFENCVNTLLSKYPFVSKKDLKNFDKIFHKSGLIGERDFKEILSDLLTEDDPWRDSREEVYLSALERCSLLVSGNPENGLLKELLTLDRFKRHLGSNKRHSKHKRGRHSKSTSKSRGGPKLRQKRDVGSFAFASSSAGGQGGFQAGNPIEPFIRNTLVSSNVFTKVFHTGLQKNDAKVIAQDVTKAALYGYNTAVINDAVNAMTGALSFTTYITNSENYAFLFAKSISAVLKRYELLPQANGNQIANNMIREIQRLLGDSPPTQAPVYVRQDNRGVAAAQAGANNQRQNFPPIQPSPVIMIRPEDKVAIFRNKLTSLLAESKELKDLFCQGSTPNIFQTVKRSLSEYGLKVSVDAAVLATDAFMALNLDQSCSQHANILSEVVRDVLFDNGLLDSAKPEDLASKIISSAKTYSNPPSRLQPEMPKGNYQNPLPLLPSFPEAPLLSNNKKEEFHGNPGTVQKGFLNPPTQAPTVYQGKVQNPMPGIQTPPLQVASFQSEPSNQRAVDVRDDAFAFIVKLDLQNTLSRSDRFASIFKPGIVPNDAANYASRMARAVLISYDPAILPTADNQIREAVFKLPIGSQTSDYCEAFASAFTDILNKNGLIRKVDSKYVGETVLNALEETVSGERLGRITGSPPLLPETTPDTKPNLKPVEMLEENTSGGADQSFYPTTPIEIPHHSDSRDSPNLSTSQYELTPTSTMAPQIATTEIVPDYTEASEFIKAFMHAFDMFTSAPDQNSESFSDVVGNPEKLSGILEDEMESSMRALSQSESSEGKESDSKAPSSTKSRDNADSRATNAGKQAILSEKQSPAQNTSAENTNASTGVAETSSQSGTFEGNQATKLESSFTPTPVTFREEDERKSEMLKKVSFISNSGISLIRSQNFNVKELCSTLNGFAEVVGIEPIPYGNCAEIPLIDYLLHVLREVSSTVKKN